MNICPKLPVYPLPNEGESFKGYVTRLAYKNGLDGLSSFLRYMGVTNSPKLIFKIGSNKSNQFIQELSPLIGVSADTLLTFFEQEREIFQTKYVSVRHINDTSPSICQTCMKKTGYIKSEWHHYYSVYCNEHKEKLHKNCQKCGSLFEWDSTLFKGCTNCGHEWGRFKTIKSQRSLFQHHLSKVKGDEYKNLYSKLTANLNIGMRPFDASFVNIRDIGEFVPDITPHLDFTYLLTHSKQPIKRLKTERIKNFQKTIDGYAPITIINQAEAANDAIYDRLKSNNAANDDYWISPTSASHNVLTAHRRKNTSEKHAHLEMSWPQLTKILNMSINDVKTLIKMNILPKREHYNNSKKVSPSRLDEVVTLFNHLKDKSLSMSEADTPLIQWSNRKAYQKLKIKRINVLACAVEGKIKVYSPDKIDHSFEQFWFCTTEIKRCLNI